MQLFIGAIQVKNEFLKRQSPVVAEQKFGSSCNFPEVRNLDFMSKPLSFRYWVN